MIVNIFSHFVGWHTNFLSLVKFNLPMFSFVTCFRYSSFVFVQFVYNVCTCGSPWVYPTCSLLNLLKMWTNVFFYQSSEIFTHYLSKYSSLPCVSPLLGLPLTTLVYLMSLHRYLRLFSFFSLFLGLHDFNWLVFNLVSFLVPNQICHRFLMVNF